MIIKLLSYKIIRLLLDNYIKKLQSLYNHFSHKTYSNKLLKHVTLSF